jgi:hypothetical protein
MLESRWLGPKGERFCTSSSGPERQIFYFQQLEIWYSICGTTRLRYPADAVVRISGLGEFHRNPKVPEGRMRKLGKLLGIMACLAVVCAVPSAVRADTSYSVNFAVGGGGVTGVIDTDGATGSLTSGDITDWNLVLNDGTTTFDLQGPLSGANSALLLEGSGLVASASNLTFDFGSDSFVLFQNPVIGSGIDFWCLEGSAPCSSNPSTTNLFIQVGAYQITPEDGVQVVATSSSVTAPEPNSMILLFSGLVGLVLLAGLKKTTRVIAN